MSNWQKVSSAGATENLNQQAVLAWATGCIDQIAAAEGAADRIGDLLDWLAHFTREYFGFQQRILNGCSEQRQYLFERIAVHNEFRRRLAQLYIDTVRCETGVADRLRDLCHDLLADAQMQQENLARILGNGGNAPRLRRQTRRGEPAAAAVSLFGITNDKDLLPQ